MSVAANSASAGAASAAEAPPQRRAAVERARQAWISRLIDLSQRNNLLYFRPLKVGTLDLTSADRDALADLLSGRTVALGKLLPQADRVKLAAQVKQIARKARENFEERGLETLFLAAGMATWQGEEGKRPPESAVLLVPITVNARERAGPTLKRSGEPQVNPVLLHVLSSGFRCELDPEQILSAADSARPGRHVPETRLPPMARLKSPIEGRFDPCPDRLDTSPNDRDTRSNHRDTRSDNLGTRSDSVDSGPLDETSRSGRSSSRPPAPTTGPARLSSRPDDPALLSTPADPDRDDDSFDLDALLATLDELGRGIQGFGVRRTVVLGNFSFQKMAMVRDLRELPEQLIASDVVAALAGDVEAQQRACGGDRAADPDPREFDQIPPQKEFLILDTDSTQQKAIAVARSGRSTVIQGPPGTGKSQVIANLIVAAAAEGKRVLFVAEKRAALQVVLDRLARVGLGHLALDLHGADTSRKIIATRMREALDYIGKGEPVVSDAMLYQFEDRRKRLNAHVQRLHAPRKPSELSVFQLQARLLRPPESSELTTRFRGAALMKLDSNAVSEAKDLLAKAADLGSLFLRTDGSPWANATYTDGHAAQAAMDLAARLANSVWPDARQQITTAVLSLRSIPPGSLDEAERILAVAADVEQFLESYEAAVFEENLEAHAASLAPAERGGVARLWATITSARYRHAQRTLQKHARTPRSAQELLADTRHAIELQRRWVEAQMSSPHPKRAGVAAALQTARAARAQLETLGSDLGSEALTALRFEQLDHRLNALRDDALTPRRIPSLRQVEKRLSELGLDPLVGELRGLPPQTASATSVHWPARFERAWFQSCLDHALAEDPELASFSGQVHSRFVAEFCELDRQRLALAARRVAAKHVGDAIRTLSALSSQASIIRREAEKKMRHLPFRKLMEQSPDVLAAIFPCFMCSPLSVSQLLPGDRRQFDLVIFDEASQVLPEDAVPSLMRGGQAVVAGDQHQLPPTLFFADAGEDGDADAAPEEEDAAIEGFESLLSMMSAFVPAPMLQWHYRSRDERLITFSNQHIYGSRLVTFPSAGGWAAVEHVLVEPGEAAPAGRDDSVSAEVLRVVELVLEHAERELAKPEPRQRRSLGVIALGITHARRIEGAIDQALERRPELEEFFDPSLPERFFVKNLERVQGDERDVILLTLGVAPDRAGRVSLTRFGPLNNREHGYRRLNVAVTRARYRMVLISAFAHHGIDASREMSRGMELLRHYLEYASRGGTLPEGMRSGEPLNEFEADVANALAAQGIKTVPQWGTSGYRIDLVAQHPSDPGRFVLAIECDGASYHSAPTARDRDRLRQQHLEALGWRFHRIWSTDWFLRRALELKRAVAAYETAAGEVRGDV